MISEFNSSTFFRNSENCYFLCFHRFGMFLNILNIYVMFCQGLHVLGIHACMHCLSLPIAGSNLTLLL